jgi:hypothetical protein
VAALKHVNNLNEATTLDEIILAEECGLPDDRMEVASTKVINIEGMAARVNLMIMMECEGVRV